MESDQFLFKGIFCAIAFVIIILRNHLANVWFQAIFFFMSISLAIKSKHGAKFGASHSKTRIRGQAGGEGGQTELELKLIERKCIQICPTSMALFCEKLHKTTCTTVEFML